MTSSNILLVEDDASVAKVIVSALDTEEVNIECCDSVGRRDEMLKAKDFDLLITDVGLGDEDGLTTLDAVNVISPDMPIIVISARNTLDTAVRASETGAFEYFPKPFDLDELTEAVQQALSKSKEV